MSNDFGFPAYSISGNGLTIPVNSGTPDAEGSYWFMEDLDGWDSPDVRVTMLPRLGQDGEVPGDLHYRGRTLILRNGWAESASEAERQSSRDLIAAATNLKLGNAGLLLVNEIVPKQCSIVRAGNAGQGKLLVVYNRTGIRPGNPGFAGLSSAGFKYLLKWQAELYAEDPLKYSQTLSSIAFAAGAASCPNAGTATTYPVISITTGGSDPIVITNTTTGQSLHLHVPTIPVPPGPLPAMPAVLNIDMYLRQITDGSGNPANFVRVLTTEFFGLAPGANAITVSPSLTGTVAYRSAWI